MLSCKCEDTSNLRLRYTEYLQAAIEGIKEMQAKMNGSETMFLNLGRNFNVDTYSMFERKAISMLEVPGTETAWERPPGLGILPLKIVFDVCWTIQNFLGYDEDNTVVRFSIVYCAGQSHIRPRVFSKPLNAVLNFVLQIPAGPAGSQPCCEHHMYLWSTELDWTTCIMEAIVSPALNLPICMDILLPLRPD